MLIVELYSYPVFAWKFKRTSYSNIDIRIFFVFILLSFFFLFNVYIDTLNWSFYRIIPLPPRHIYNRLTIVLGIIALISRNEYSRGGGKRVHLLYPLIRIKEKLERIFIYILFCLFVCRQKKFAIICTVIRKVGGGGERKRKKEGGNERTREKSWKCGRERKRRKEGCNKARNAKKEDKTRKVKRTEAQLNPRTTIFLSLILTSDLDSSTLSLFRYLRLPLFLRLFPSFDAHHPNITAHG